MLVYYSTKTFVFQPQIQKNIKFPIFVEFTYEMRTGGFYKDPACFTFGD